MQKILVALGFLFSAAVASSAAPDANPEPIYDMKIEVSIDGKRAATPRVITRAGAKAVVSEKEGSQETYIEVTANPHERDARAISMAFVVGTVGKNGERVPLDRMMIIAAENQKAILSSENAQTGKKVEIAVIATEKR